MESTRQANTYEIKNLTFTYPDRIRPALDGVSLTVGRGQFTILCGASGCGKTTLLRQLKPSAAPHGAIDGAIYFEGEPLSGLEHRAASARIGFVTQNPDNQIVTDKVWHELAFGLESLGLSTPEIRLRVAEMASFFGIQNWFYKNVTELSGGQKQLLNLASVMAMQPSVLILDEPTSQLDPIAAAEFLDTIAKINRELGITVIMTEHRLEDALPLCDKAVVMDGGRIIGEGSPREVGAMLRGLDHGMFLAMPAPMRIWAGVNNDYDAPITVRDGRDWLSHMNLVGAAAFAPPAPLPNIAATPAVALDEVWFKYERDLPDVVRGADFTARYGEISAILGGNGTGKTTTLSLIAGINQPYRGKVLINGKPLSAQESLFNGLLGVLPQNPQALFVAKTVEEDLLEMLSGASSETAKKLTRAEKQSRVLAMARLCRVEPLLKSHPYDLSGGEQQRAALAKVLLTRPRILLLDEPTKGLDAEFKSEFAGILKKLTAAGVAVVMVSHDVEFCAEYADFCAMFFDGNIVTQSEPRAFFAGNSFYTTSANRMARHMLPDAVTVADVIAALGGTVAPPLSRDDDDDIDYAQFQEEPPQIADKAAPKLSLRRRLAAGAAATALIATAVLALLNFDGFRAFISGGDLALSVTQDAAQTWLYVALMLALAVEAVVLTLALTWKRTAPQTIVQVAAGKRRLSKRTVMAAAMILLAIPLTIFIGIFYLDDRKYYFISLMIILETMVPFALVFESRKPQARELVIIATLCAIAVAGRTAFFMLPQFKPVVALVIVAGVAFGGEAGFLVGAMTALVSNFFFSQGPWTPWQMFAFGIIGFLAGVLFRKGLLRRNNAALCVFGALATLAIYGGIMDTAQVFIYQTAPTREMFAAAYLQGLPFNLVHAAATVVFLLIAAQPMLEKLDRIKVKYGLVE